MKLTDLTNLYLPMVDEINSQETKGLFRRELTLEEFLSFTVCYCKKEFCCQDYTEDKIEGDAGIFYIQKYNKILTFPNFYNFIKEHQEEKFLLCSDNYGCHDQVRAFIDSKPNKIKISFLGNYSGTGKLHLIASLENKEGTAEWEKSQVFEKGNILSFDKDNYRSSYEIQFTEKLGLESRRRSWSYSTDITEFLILNKNERKLDTHNIMLKYLNLPGYTRIIFSLCWGNNPYYFVSIGDIATKDLQFRYGLNIRKGDSDATSDYFYLHESLDEELDERTKERVFGEIRQILKNGGGKDSKIGRYHDEVMVKTCARIVISEARKGHRRPIYHYIKGFSYSGAIDIVELARGELQMKDMTPVNLYWLDANDGGFKRTAYNLFGNLKSMILEDGQVDRVSFQEWNEEKSLHPELLKAMGDYMETHENNIDLHKVKLMNRLPFGALFLEQLIKSEKADLAIAFAEEITEKADNMNYGVSTLSDIIPGTNPEGKSLMETLILNKPCFNLLFNNDFNKNSLVYRFVEKYKTIRHFCPDNVLNKEREKMISLYLELSGMNKTNFSVANGEKVNLLEHPNEIKIMYKMFNKLKNTFGGERYYGEAERHYEEILDAYFKFQSMGWDPAESMIFIEFAIGGETPSQKLECLKMLEDREKAATEALKIYQDKIDEIAHQAIEEKYAYRKKFLKKLESTKELGKEKGSLFKNNYVVIMPSQIYGKEVVGSIEKEGKDMGHCVFRTYANQIANGDYTVLYLRSKNHPEESLVTIGITREGKINQTYGEHDQTITQEQAQAIIEWAKSKPGLVSFKGESGYNYTPGGWPHSIEVPSLPKVKAENIANLAKISD